ALSTNVLLEVVKGAINVVSGNWLELAKNIIKVGQESLGDDGTLDNNTIAAMVDDYIVNGNKIYLGTMENITESYEERESCPCYYDHEFHHEYENIVTTPPGCTTEGVMTVRCTVCNDSYQEPIQPEGHSFVSTTLYEPECTKEGISKNECSKCHAVSYEAIPAVGHTTRVVPGKPASCSETGLTAGTVCTVCGEVVTPQDVIPKTEHDYEYVYDAENDQYSAVCRNCGDTVVYNYSDVTALVAAVEKGRSINPDDYSEESYNEMYAAIEPYFNVNLYLGLKYPQEITDSITADIITKIEDLVPYVQINISHNTGGGAISAFNGENGKTGTTKMLSGSTVTLTADPEEGYTFIGWYDTDNMRYASYDSEYTFILKSNTNIRAVYKRSGTVTLTYKSYSGQVIKEVSKTVEEWNTYEVLRSLDPEVPYRYGYSDGKWDYFSPTVLAVLKAGNDAEVFASYTTGEAILPELPINTSQTEPAMDMTYTFNSETQVGTLFYVFDIPENCDVREIGIIAAIKPVSGFDPREYELTINNQTTSYKYVQGNSSGRYILNLKGMTDRYSRAYRGYVIYLDSRGKLRTVYSNQINLINKQSV
ncbi:MAG: InlB B-repeat-containing protein, partial [Eubacterium sp.]|nr:InlB B-repeat-containing protein [Eubacterium sp.]